MNARISRDEKILSFSVLIVAVFSASTAGAIFSVLEDEPLFSQQKGDKSAMLLASSRLTATAIVQSPIFLYCCYNYYHYRGGEGGRGERIYGRGRRRTTTTINNNNNNNNVISWSHMDKKDMYYLRDNIHMFILSGLFLSLHFYFWMNGLVRTSLSHSLLFVTSSPIAYVCLTALTFRSKKVQNLIVWVVKNMKKKGAETNDIDDIDESTANGGEIELRECSVEEGKEEEENNDGAFDEEEEEENDELKELYIVPSSSASTPSHPSPDLLRFKDVSKYEVIGAIMGFIGSCIIAFDATNNNGSKNSNSSSSSSSSSIHRSNNDRPSLKGDILCLLSAILVCGYIAIGAKIRSDRPLMPIFVYSFPIVVSAAAVLQILVVLLYAFDSNNKSSSGDSAINDDDGSFSPMVFLESYRWMEFWEPTVRKTFFLVLFLAIVPGTLGHSGFFVAMRHLSSLTVTFALSFEPIIGSTIGYFMNVSSIPGFATFLGGFMLLVGVYCCNMK